MAKGMPNAISVLAVAERGAMFDPSAVFYMNKIAAGPDVADFIDITSPIAANIQRIAKVRKASVSDITVRILDRPRHEKLMAEVRAAGARIRLISDGDVAGAISACRPDSGTDLLVGIGGTPRASSPPPRSAAWAARSRRPWPRRTTRNARKAIDRGHDLDRCSGPKIWSAGERSSAPPA